VITERAHAKLNVFLRVLGRRPDGFHDIQTLILPLDLADVISVEEAEATTVRVEGTRAADLADAGGESLCARAVEAFTAATAIATAVEVHVDKRIPVAAGMGGGSADAAAVLRALARMHGVDPAGLSDVARSVGADVPALLHGGAVKSGLLSSLTRTARPHLGGSVRSPDYVASYLHTGRVDRVMPRILASPPASAT
jgi:4-diphosphocytidyl-2-C-methyl-D-erythritol kinase